MAEYKTILGEARLPANLVVEKGAATGTAVPITKHQIIIGRDSGTADLVINDPLASRRHARISWIATKYVIEDLDSSNGTIVNNELLTKSRLLQSGDRISIGESIFLFQLKGDEKEKDESPAAQLIDRTYVLEPSKSKNIGIVPARMILDTATQVNRRLGHENLGFLSEESGFLPITPPLACRLAMKRGTK
ncbi:MAG: FHA domain-containing protein [Chloroflexi bacterium]|nr:FHA domain-containing protein [Chloroflexota bacterium]